MDIAKKILPFFIIIFLCTLALKPLFNSGFFPMHDNTQPTRVYEMYKALQDGNFPVRWVENLGYGYGYPIFNFYAPLPYYIGAISMFSGLDAITAAKVMFGLGFIISGITMFLLGRKLFGIYGGFIAALLYVYAPYHAVQIYIRGAVGEYWAYAFLPLVFYGLLGDKKHISIKNILAGIIGLSAIILSHTITGYIMVLLLGLLLVLDFIWRSVKEKKIICNKEILLVVIATLCITSFFWLPALIESRFVRTQSLIEGTNDFHSHFVYLDQLWNSPWGFAGSAPGHADGISFRLGKLHLMLAIVSLVICIYSIKKRLRKELFLWLFLVGGLLISIFMMTEWSVSIWEHIPGFAYIQYPWRFLMFSAFFSSLLGGSIFLILPKNNYRDHILVVIASLAIGAFYLKLFTPQYLESKSVSAYTDLSVIRWDISKISDEYIPLGVQIPQSESGVISQKFTKSDDIIIKEQEVKTQFVRLLVSALQPGEIVFSIADFPGWKVFIDNKIYIPELKNGLIAVAVPAGEHTIHIMFTDTPVRLIGNWLSFVSMTILLSLLTRQLLKN